MVNNISVTGSIACSTKRPYFSYSEGNFEIFRPAGATVNMLRQWG